MDIFFPFKTYSYIMFYLLALYVGTTALLACVFRVRVLEINIFNGPIRKQHHINGIIINRRLIPIGASITLLHKENAKEYNLLEENYFNRFDQISLWKRITVIMAGNIGLFFFALLVMGPLETVNHTLTGFYQIYIGALLPHTYGQQYLESLFDIYVNKSEWLAFGIVSTKQLAFNLIPFFGSATYISVVELIEQISKKPVNSHVTLMTLPLFMALAIPIAGWSIAFGIYSWNYMFSG